MLPGVWLWLLEQNMGVEKTKKMYMLSNWNLKLFKEKAQ